MPRIPVAAAAKKLWIVLVIVVVVAVARFCVFRLRSIFGAHDNAPDYQRHRRRHQAVQPQARGLEVYGPPGTVANINYLDINAQPGE